MMQVATVLTVYGIETFFEHFGRLSSTIVATVLTVYGIETHMIIVVVPRGNLKLQQYLPFTVLNRILRPKPRVD